MPPQVYPTRTAATFDMIKKSRWLIINTEERLNPWYLHPVTMMSARPFLLMAKFGGAAVVVRRDVLDARPKVLEAWPMARLRRARADSHAFVRRA